MRSRTRSSSRPGAALVSRVRASSSPRPRSSSSGSPSKSCPVFGSRTATTIPTDSASSRPGDEAEDHSRGGVQPLSVLHETEQRPLFGRGGQQAEHGEADEEAIRHVTGCQAQRDIQRVSLRLRESVELVEQRRAELMDPGERQLHLRFRAGDLHHTESRGTIGGVAEQRRLSDARLASEDEEGALTPAHVVPGAGRGLRARWSGQAARAQGRPPFGAKS